MRRIVPPLLLALVLSGCADQTGPEVDQAFADVERVPAELAEATGLPEDFLLINGSVVEGRVDGSGGWSSSVRAEPGPIAHVGGPATVGGGGTRVDLPAHALGTLEVRLNQTAGLGDLTVVWVGTADGSFAEGAHLGNTTGDETLEIPFPAGVRNIFAVVMDEEEPVAATLVPLRISALLTWEVRDSVHPVNPQGMVPMDDAQRERMADRFVLPAPAGATLHTVTAFDGTWTPEKGTDVDLEFLDADGRSVGYIGAGGSSLLPVDPAQAAETLEAGVGEGGDWTVRIGYVSTACGGCYYHNAGPVPYRAVITLDTS